MKRVPSIHCRMARRLCARVLAVCAVMGILVTGGMLLAGCRSSDAPPQPATPTRVQHPTVVPTIALSTSQVAEAADPTLPPTRTETWTPPATRTPLPTSTPTGTATRTRAPTRTPPSTPSPTRTAESTATATETTPPKPTPTVEVAQTPRVDATPRPSLAVASGSAPAHANHLGTEKVVIADYMLWYGPEVFDGTTTWDVPAGRPLQFG